jgi:uncharacterized membrane protein YedE/YeeE
MYALSAFVAGLLFGLGLIVSGLANPAKVLAFLDVTGKWDPTLLLVIASSVAVSAVGFAIAGRRSETLLGTPMQLPTVRGVDRRLFIGSALFGIGWGLAGFCPGPALVALGAMHLKAFAFVAAMVTGMVIYEAIERRRAVVAPSPAAAVGRSE